MNPQPSEIYVCITELTDESGSCVYNRTGIITQYSPVITGEINVGFLNDNKKWSVNIILIYDSGLEIVSNSSMDISEYIIKYKIYLMTLYIQVRLMYKEEM